MKRLTRNEKRKTDTSHGSKVAGEKNGNVTDQAEGDVQWKEAIEAGMSPDAVETHSLPKPVAAKHTVVDGEGWYPGKRELTLREEALREKDCKVEYSGVVPSYMEKGLDVQRRANWVPPSEVEKMPQWKPVLQPVVDEVIEESVKEVSAYMGTEAKGDKEKVVEKLVAKVLKKLPKHDKGLVETRVWGSLQALKIEQGISNKGLINKSL